MHTHGTPRHAHASHITDKLFLLHRSVQGLCNYYRICSLLIFTLMIHKILKISFFFLGFSVVVLLFVFLRYFWGALFYFLFFLWLRNSTVNEIPHLLLHSYSYFSKPPFHLCSLITEPARWT